MRITFSCYVCQCYSSSVTIIGDFFSHFVWGKIMAATRQDRGKRHLLDTSSAAKLFVWLTELSWSDVRDTCVSSRHFLPAQKTLNIVTLPL